MLVFQKGLAYMYLYIYMHNKFITSWTSLLNILLINIADKFIVLGTLNTETSENISYISVTHKVLKSCRNKMATLAHDICDVQGASLYIYKTCWQGLYGVFPTWRMGESPHQQKICSFTPSTPNFYSLPPKVNST